MTFSEILEMILSYLNDSALMANIALVLTFLLGLVRTFKRPVTPTANVVVSSNNDEEVRELKNELVAMKEMFLVAFNNSKLDTATKLRLSELATKSQVVKQNVNGVIELAKSIDVKNDIVNPIKEQIVSKIDGVVNTKNTDLLKQLSEKINNL